MSGEEQKAFIDLFRKYTALLKESMQELNTEGEEEK